MNTLIIQWWPAAACARARCAILLLLLLAGLVPAAAASISRAPDTNSRLEYANTVVSGSEATALFFSWPDRGDPNYGNACALYFYTVTYRQGLASPARPVAGDVCGNGLARARLLDNGDTLMQLGDKIERWRGGKRIARFDLSAHPATRKLGVGTVAGGEKFSFSGAGGVVMVLPASGYMDKRFQDSAAVLVSLTPEGERRWEYILPPEGLGTTVHDLWAGEDGGALVHLQVISGSGIQVGMETRLLYVDAAGRPFPLPLVKPEDLSRFENLKPEDMASFYEYQRNADPESVERVGAAPRVGGGFDVLYQRKGGGPEREGHFLRRTGPKGAVLAEYALGGDIVEHGLEKWADFYVDDKQLLLLSSVVATQPGVKARRNKWSQNAVSWVDLASGKPPVTRLIPLDQRYLVAALNAGDEQMQYLQGFPGADPKALVKYGDTPLVAASGWVERKWSLRLDEAGDTLRTFTETIDNKRAELAKQQARVARKAERTDRQQRMQAEMAASVGMTPEAFAALPRAEQKELLVRRGDLGALFAAAQRESAQAMAAAGEATQANQAQLQQLPNIPGMTPEQQAQMQAAMAQMQAMQQQMQGGGAEAAKQGGAVTSPDQVLAVDAAMRGFIEFEHSSGLALRIYNRSSGDKLLERQYADGVIYEYIDFSQFKLPAAQIGVRIKDSNGKTLREMVPVMGGG